MRNTLFYQQANLLLDILPLIANEKRFALKGGTAINFFIRNLPRLSVDIDLTWLPIEDRETTLTKMDQALKELSGQIEQKIPTVGISFKRLKNTNLVTGLIIRREDASVKIEPNLVFRGTVYPPEKRILVQKAQDEFEKAVQVQSLSVAEVYAGKICAALDRQHPRDLFDIKLLFENEGLSDTIRKAFIVYLISHNRPMLELLNPNRIDIERIFELEFKGMAFEPVNLNDLLEARERLIHEINHSLTVEEKQFILSVKAGQPEWEQFPIEHVRHLPAVQWKLQNIRMMDKNKHQQALNKLAAFLELT